MNPVFPTRLKSPHFRRVEVRSHPEFPSTHLLVCAKCKEQAQVSSEGCPEPHGNANPAAVRWHLCAVLGHLVVINRRSTGRCLRCRRPRSEVVV